MRGRRLPSELDGAERKSATASSSALLERLDRLTAELHGLNRRLDAGENLAPLVHELRALNESLSRARLRRARRRPGRRSGAPRA